MADLSDDIEQAAKDPKSHSVDGETAVSRSVAEMIAADKYLQAKAAATAKKTGLRFSKIVPGSGPGAGVQ